MLPFLSGAEGTDRKKSGRDCFFKVTSMAVERSANGQNETQESWKVPVKIPFFQF